MTEPLGRRVCAVVVTYNRSALLRECLDAVLAQTHPIDVLVFDNASTDDTPDVLAEYAGRVRVTRLTKNSGGAGGFHAGMVQALMTDADWFWLMDDDTIARPDCVEQLLAAADRCPLPVDVLASRVEWIDGRRHPMNSGAVDARHDKAEAAAAAGCVAMRYASFVSVMVPRRAVLDHGLPLADYFIWGDDVEYTMRLTRQGLGLLVPQSVAVHKTAYFSLDTPGARYYFHVRNSFWTIRFSPAVRGERLGQLARHVKEMAKLQARHQPWVVRRAALRGLRDGLGTRPDLTPLERMASANPGALRTTA